MLFKRQTRIIWYSLKIWFKQLIESAFRIFTQFSLHEITIKCFKLVLHKLVVWFQTFCWDQWYLNTSILGLFPTSFQLHVFPTYKIYGFQIKTHLPIGWSDINASILVLKFQKYCKKFHREPSDFWNLFSDKIVPFYFLNELTVNKSLLSETSKSCHLIGEVTVWSLWTDNRDIISMGFILWFVSLSNKLKLEW